MSQDNPSAIDESHPHGDVKSYTIGFILSIVLTFAAYLLVARELLHGWQLTLAIILLGIGQTWVQLRLFLHLGEEAWPKWNLLSFLFMALVVLIIVGGSIWIMTHLNERVMIMPDMLPATEMKEGSMPMQMPNMAPVH